MLRMAGLFVPIITYVGFFTSFICANISVVPSFPVLLLLLTCLDTYCVLYLAFGPTVLSYLLNCIKKPPPTSFCCRNRKI